MPDPLCRFCGDPLPGAPPGVTSCKEWARWQARQLGDTVTDADAADLSALPGLCALDVALRDGLDELPKECL